MQKTLYFCDKCGKQTNHHKNGDDTKNLYAFKIDNCRNFHAMDRHGYDIELCGECSELFAEFIRDFYEYVDTQQHIYKSNIATKSSKVATI